MHRVSTTSLAPGGLVAGAVLSPRQASAAEMVEYVLGTLRLRELVPARPPEAPPWLWDGIFGLPGAIALLVIAGWIAWRMRPGRAARPRRVRVTAPGLSRRQILAHVRGQSLVIVSRQHPLLFDYLARELRRERRVEVVVDRRWGERRNRPSDDWSERRRGDRRRPDAARDLRHHPFVIVPREQTVQVGSSAAAS